MIHGRLHSFRVFPGPYQVVVSDAAGRLVLESHNREGEAETIYRRLLPDRTWTDVLSYEDVAEELASEREAGRLILLSVKRRWRVVLRNRIHSRLRALVRPFS